MGYVSLGNPIWSGQFQLLGGLRRVAATTIVYGAAVLVAFLMYRRIQSQTALPTVANDAIKVLSWIQVGILVIGGSNSIHRALMRDHATRMLESLRTSIMSAFTVVFGYLIGPLTQVFGLWLVGGLIGAGLAIAGGGGATEWVAGNLLLLLACAVAWSAQLYFGLGSRRPVNVVLIVYVICFVLHGIAQGVPLLPGLEIFAGAYIAFIGQGVMRGNVFPGAQLVVAIPCALLMFVFWCFAAGRRFRKPFLPFPAIHESLVILALWTVCSVVSFATIDRLYPGASVSSSIESWQLALIVQSMLAFCCLVASSAVRTRRRLIMGACDARGVERWPPIAQALIAAGIAVAGTVLLVQSRRGDFDEILSGGCVLLAASLAACGVFKITEFRWNSTGLAWIILAVMWLLSIMAWAILRAAGIGGGRSATLDLLAGVSPVFVLWTVWLESAVAVVPHLAVQVIVAVVMLAMGYSAERLFVRRRAVKLREEDEIAERDQLIPSNNGVER